MRVVALQSGTSVDAIDVAVVEFAQPAGSDALELRPVLTASRPWPDDLRRRLLAVAHGAAVTAAEWCELDTRAGQLFADAAAWAIEQTDAAPDLVVSHGQTVFHWVAAGRARGTLQLGQPAWIAERTGAAVLSDVRSADIAAGGEGAPLMAAFDRAWLGADARAAGRPIATANLGGIANLQVVHPDGRVDAFDTGPGNALVDAVVARATEGAERFDRDGTRARRGRVDEAVLAALLAHPYFAAPAPKTTGRETFGPEVVDEAVRAADAAPALDDLVATLVECTARTVLDAVPDGVAELVCSGGGVRNPVLFDRLRAIGAARGIVVASSADRGVDPDAKESLMFALLGWMTANDVPLQLASGARGEPRIAGRMSPGRPRAGRRSRHPLDAAAIELVVAALEPTGAAR